MKTFFLIVLAISLQAGGADLKQLSVLYIADGDYGRTASFRKFLESYVAKCDVIERSAFKPADAQPFDVVLLDWHQGENTAEERKRPCPLGDRSSWAKPTVLLGSAGLNVAVVWQVRGGGG